MYRKIVWCYVFILTLLDISLNTKLSAQGKSHGVTVHDSLIEGITFQEWGKESVEEGAGRSGGPGAGRAMSAGALSLSPPSLEFGHAALAAAHALTVTLTNTANTTMHLASVAGTTPDFHASFFESKTLPPQANTTFSVVYLGRREGPVSAHLYIHTSLGVHKYPVSAVGVASEWGVWPLVGVRVPINATVEPLLTMHNPTDQTIQVTEIYSSGSWLGLQLPDGGSAAPRDAWRLAPGSTRPLVRLRLKPHHVAHQPHHSHHPHNPHHAQPLTLTAYVRIKANITGGGLVVCVEARSTEPGEFASPLQLRLRTRGSRDPADKLDISLGNSGSEGVSLEAGVWAARCSPSPPAWPPASPPTPPAPPPTHAPSHNGETKGTANGNGVKSEGVYVSLTRPYLEPHLQLTHAAQLTLDYGKMWAGYGGAEGVEGAEGVWCGGWVALGRAALPYSVRLLPGTLLLEPDTLHFVTSDHEEALSSREVRVRNEFPVPVHISKIDFGPDVEQYFEVESLPGQTVGSGGSGLVARVRLRAEALGVPLRTHLVLRTNLTDYTLPLLVYSGRFDIEWDWPMSGDGTLRLGALGASSTRRVSAALHNRGVAPLCVRDLLVALPGAMLALRDCAEPLHANQPTPPPTSCRCAPAGGRLWMQLTVVAPARAGALGGHVRVRASPGGSTAARVELAAHPGRLTAHPLAHVHAAPYAWSSAPLVLESTMSLLMRMTHVTLPPDNPALSYTPGTEGSSDEVSTGRNTVGTVVFAAEKLCEPNCYTGLDLDTPEGRAWERRGAAPDEAALRQDAALQGARHALYAQQPRALNVSLHAHTTQVVQIPVSGTVSTWWPRLAMSSGDAGLAGVGGAVPLKIRVRNPSHTHPILMQPVVGGPVPLVSVGVPPLCAERERCVGAAGAFRLEQWRALRGAVASWRGVHNASGALDVLLLAPAAELELRLTFAPTIAAPLTAFLYLRNNLTILEGVQLSGRGAYPSFEIGGRRPGTNSPLLFEVNSCGSVRRTVVARNTGAVEVRLRGWTLAGEPCRAAGEGCQARGFHLEPCAALTLAPNQSRPLTIAFTADWTLAKVHATLQLKSELGRASFPLAAAAPARLLAKCGGATPRPPWEGALRAAGALAALAALALVLAAAALDAERELRRARAQRPPLPPPAARQPLDLRALAHEPQAPPQPVQRRPPPRRRRPPRPPVDPAAERRAFERWRQDVLGAQDDEERSSEDNDRRDRPEHAPTDDAAPLLEAEAFEPVDEAPGVANDGYEADPETEDRPPGSGDEDAISTGSGSVSASSSSPVAEVDEADEGDERDRSPRGRPRPECNESPVATPRVPPVDTIVRGGRQRRDTSETPRRGERSKTAEGEGAGRARAAGKAHARKALARRRSRPASPPRSPGDALRGSARAPGALRWGASWSSVVAARPGPAPLAPIGSHVPRRAEPASDHSLFYFNGDPAHSPPREPDFAWRPPPPVDRPAFSPARDPAFLDESVGAGNGSYRSINSVWGGTLEPRPAAAAWLWGGLGDGAAVRPPPGFGAPVRPVRPYDPFRSLASIWAPGALDWRDDPPAPDESGAPH